MKPATKYTKSGDVNIAYQVFGSGAIDLVYIPGWISNIDLMWACPELVYFLQELGKIARVILFDKRGTGLSDRVVDFATLEERMDDIRAVMDAVGSEKAVLFGHSEGGSVSALFAATYPNRTISLIAFGIFAKRIYSPNYPWAPTNEERQEVYDMIENNWGSGEMNLESLAPSKADDPVFMSWLANYFRSGASPSAAMTLTKMNTQVDIIDILSSIKVPSLIMQRTNDIDVKVEEGRFIADRIEDAKFIELAGSDHLFWTGNTNEVLQEMKAFILNVKPKPIYEKQLFTIIVGHFVSMKNNINHQNYVDQLVKKYGGNIIQNSTRTFTVIFKAPSNAILCSHDLVGEMAGLDLKLNIWMHIKECYADHVMSTDTEGKVVSVLQELKSNQILLTQTLKNLLIGVELNFSYYKTVIDPESNESNESIELYAVNKMEKQKELPNADKILPAETISFMEAVMQAIHANLDNECFGVEMLCKKIGMSERKLQRRLKAITQKPPRQLISSIRLHRAKELIASTNYTISEIAFRTGFTNPSYFSKAFKKEFRMSPSDLKK